MGTHIVAGKGSGKSRLMGRIIAFLDFLQGVPTVIFDPHGGTIEISLIGCYVYQGYTKSDFGKGLSISI